MKLIKDREKGVRGDEGGGRGGLYTYRYTVTTRMKLRSVGLPLCTKSLAVCDQREGWSLLRAAARLVWVNPQTVAMKY